MDYEKKYKQLHTLINDLYPFMSEYCKEKVEGFFPELAESEDEKTERILHSISSKMSLHLSDTFTEEEFQCFDAWSNAWLEKQENRKTRICQEGVVTKGYAVTEPEKYFRGVSAPIEATEATYTTEVETGDGGIKALVTGKVVMPKFKVGDWITDGYCMGKVIELTEDAYLLDTGHGIPFSCEHNAHLWTIADAKDGDVLCTYECDEPKIVFILKGTPKKPYVLSYHCYYNIMYPHFETDSKKGCLAPNDENVKPATKEQRELLFQKMKEEGYEWDAEKD